MRPLLRASLALVAVVVVATSARAQEPTSPPSEPPPVAEAPAAPAVIVVDAAAYGVDPIVARYLSDSLRETSAAMGYAVRSPAETVALAQRTQMPYPPTPADLWRLTLAAGAQRGVFARVWAQEGRYVVELTIASIDGRGPFYAREGASAAQLLSVVADALRATMPAPEPGLAQPPATSPGAASHTPTLTPASPTAAGALTADPSASRPPRARRARRRPPRRFVFALHTESAFGASEDFFYNHLFGARLDYRLTPSLSLGAYLGYANLRGKNGRASNVLFYAQIDHRVQLARSSRLRIPLRAGLGYVPFNGTYFRLAAGLAAPLSSRVEVVLDLLAPTVWFGRERTLVSLDLGAEIAYRF